MNATRFPSHLLATRLVVTIALLAAPFALRAQDVAYSDPQAAYQADPPSRVARLSVMQGNVSFQPATVNDFSAAELNYPLTSGDRLYTDNGALAEIQIGNLTARLGPQADFTITALTDQVAQFGLAQGSVILKAYQLDPGTTTEIDTPNASITVLASGVVRVDYYPEDNVTVVRELSGQVHVDADGVHQVLEGGTQVFRVSGANPSTWDSENLPRPDNLDRFSGQRDAYDRQAQASEGSYVPPDMIGAEDLASSGDWESTGDYGAIWYPNAVAADWAPYSVGRWVSIAPWGWTWVGGEPWGFAPFHYGRWIHIGNRWGWIPGPPTAHPMYSPALVAFVGGAGLSIGGGSLTAWFPLGPGEQYRPWYRTSPTYVNRVNAGGFHNNHVNNFQGGYMNRSVATTAIPVRNFGNGRPVRESAVRVDPNQLRNAPVGNRPPVAPPQRQAAAGPPARALPPLTARPVLPTRAGQNPDGNRNGNPNGYFSGQRNNGSSPTPGASTQPGNRYDRQPQPATPAQPGNTYGRQPQPATPAQPSNRYDRQPQPATPAQPGNTSDRQPQPATPAQPGNRYDRQPQPATPAQPGNTSDRQPQTATPAQPGNTYGRQPQPATSTQPGNRYDRQPQPATPAQPGNTSDRQPQPATPAQPGNTYNRQPQPATPAQPGTSTQPARSPYDRQPQPATSVQPATPSQPAHDTYERPQRQLSPTTVSPAPQPQPQPVERPNSAPQRVDQPQRQDSQRSDFQRQQPQPQTQPQPQRTEPQRPDFQRPQPQRTETRPVEPQRQPAPQPQAAPPQRIAPPTPAPPQPRPQATPAPAQPKPQP